MFRMERSVAVVGRNEGGALPRSVVSGRGTREYAEREYRPYDPPTCTSRAIRCALVNGRVYTYVLMGYVLEKFEFPIGPLAENRSAKGLHDFLDGDG